MSCRNDICINGENGEKREDGERTRRIRRKDKQHIEEDKPFAHFKKNPKNSSN